MNNLYAAAMDIQTQLQADVYLEELVARHIEETGDTREKALEVQRSQLAYFAGYYDAGTRERIERLFQCAHPISGAIAEKGQPTAEEAFAMGYKLGEESR